MGYEYLEKVMEEAKELPPDQQLKLLEMLHVLLAQSFQPSLPMVMAWAKALPVKEQGELWKVMHGWLTEQYRPTEEEFQQDLLRLGILSEIKPRVEDLTVYENRRPPMKVEGKPVSQLIIEERR